MKRRSRLLPYKTTTAFIGYHRKDGKSNITQTSHMNNVAKFFADYGIRSLLKAYRAEKQKGHSAFEIFRYLLCLVFCDRSMYMQIMTGRYTEAFGKNTVYRFLNYVKALTLY